MMTALRSWCLVLVGVTALTALASSKEPSPMTPQQVDNAKTALGFATWPGKQGPLKPGLSLDPLTVPALAGFVITKDERKLEKAGGAQTMLRSLVLTKGTDKVWLEIQVGSIETDDAQEAMITRLSNTDAGAAEAYRRGDSQGILVGDLNFIDGTAAADSTVLHFVRNNIRILVKKLVGSPVDLVAAGTTIDTLIKAEANYTKASIKAQLPKIPTFAPVSATIAVLTSTPVTLVATDPAGLPLEIQLKATMGQITKDTSVNPPTILFQADNDPGKVTLTVTVLDARLLFATHTATVTIQ